MRTTQLSFVVTLCIMMFVSTSCGESTDVESTGELEYSIWLDEIDDQISDLFEELSEADSKRRAEIGFRYWMFDYLPEEFPSKLAKGLSHPDPDVRTGICAIYCSRPDFATGFMDNLIIVLDDEFDEPRIWAGLAIAEIDHNAADVLPEIIEAINSDDKYVRWMAVRVVGKFNGSAKTAVPFLLEMLETEESGRKFLVINALGDIGTGAESAIPVLIELLVNDEDNRTNASIALVKIGEASVPELVGYLGNEDYLISNLAAVTLAKIGTPSVKPLIDKLHSENQQVSNMAGYALRRLDCTASGGVEDLVEILNDPNPVFQRTALEALHGIGEPAVPSLLVFVNDYENNPELAIMAAKAIHHMSLFSFEIFENLGELLDSENVEIRLLGIKALSATYSFYGYNIPHIVKALCDEDTEIRKIASASIEESFNDCSLPRDVHIESALREAIPFLNEMAVSDPDKAVREAAEAALEKANYFG